MPRQQYCETNSIECALWRRGSPQPVRPSTFSRVTRSLGDMDSALHYSPAAQPSAPFAASKTPELLREQSAPEESTADASG